MNIQFNDDDDDNSYPISSSTVKDKKEGSLADIFKQKKADLARKYEEE